MISVNEKIRAQQCPLSPATPRQARQGDQLRPRRPGRYVVVIDEHCSESRRRLLIGQFKRTSAVHVLCLLNHALRGKDQLPVQLSRSLREMSNSLPFFQNLTRLQDPHLAKTQVSGSLPFLPILLSFRVLALATKPLGKGRVPQRLCDILGRVAVGILPRCVCMFVCGCIGVRVCV